MMIKLLKKWVVGCNELCCITIRQKVLELKRATITGSKKSSNKPSKKPYVLE